jgi:hypothetical protein
MNSQALEASPFGNDLKPGFVAYAARRMRGQGPVRRHSNATWVVRTFWNSGATIGLRTGNQEVLADALDIIGTLLPVTFGGNVH